MGSLIASLPASLRTSTTGQGIAGLIAAGAAAVASHYTQNTELIGLSGVIAGALVLLFFPQSTGAPPASAALAGDIGGLIKAYSAWLSHGSALAPPAPGTQTETITATKETTPHA